MEAKSSIEAEKARWKEVIELSLLMGSKAYRPPFNPV